MNAIMAIYDSTLYANVKAIDLSVVSQRELDCLHWLAKGKTQDQIALILGITLRTVKAHISNTKQKLNCYTQFQLGMAYFMHHPTAVN